jgi:hypothetical protein
MKNLLPVLALLAGLGSFISFAQVASSKDPFARYMAGVKVDVLDLSLQRFATECGVNPSNTQHQFAVGPGSS